jgi:hypothetical protein
MIYRVKSAGNPNNLLKSHGIYRITFLVQVLLKAIQGHSLAGVMPQQKHDVLRKLSGT